MNNYPTTNIIKLAQKLLEINTGGTLGFIKIENDWLFWKKSEELMLGGRRLAISEIEPHKHFFIRSGARADEEGIEGCFELKIIQFPEGIALNVVNKMKENGIELSKIDLFKLIKSGISKGVYITKPIILKQELDKFNIEYTLIRIYEPI
jgi:hypothetical protein